MLNTTQEYWKPVPLEGLEHLYEVSTYGRIRSPRKLLVPWKINSGYLMIGMRKDNVKTRILMHRLVALTFIPNPDNNPEVNHINGIKSDNRVENIEWSTRSKNMLHASETGLRKRGHKPCLGRKAGKSSPYYGVSIDRHRGKWVTSIRHEGKAVNIKRFDTAIEAARWYDAGLRSLGLTDRPFNNV